MSELRIPVSLIGGQGLVIDTVVEASDLKPPGVENPSIGGVRVSGTIFGAEPGYVFMGTVSGTFRHPCDRCLDKVDVPFHTEVVWTCEQGATGRPWDESSGAGEAVATCKYEGDEIDLGPNAWEELVLAEPAKSLCREDCAGLCPHCGTNLNCESCTCPKPVEEDPVLNKGLVELGELCPELRLGPAEDTFRACTKKKIE